MPGLRRRASARRVYAEMLRALAWARDPGGRPMEDRAWAEHRRRFAIGGTVFDAVDWAYDTLRDAGPARARTAREAIALAGLARRHPELFPHGLAGTPAAATPDPDVWVWIDRAVPAGLRAVAVEAGLDPRRTLRDMAEADGRP